MDASSEQTGHAAGERLDLGGGNQRRQHGGQLTAGGQQWSEESQALHFALGEGLTGPTPQDRAQLVLGVQGDPVIDAVEASQVPESVRAFAVGVVEDDIEHREGAHVGGILVGDNERTTVLALGAQNRDQPVQPIGGVDELNHAGAHRFEVTDPLLDHAVSGRSRAQHRRRDDVPAAHRTNEVCRALAGGEGAVREVPQRGLPGDRFVDHEGPVRGWVHDELGDPGRV